MKLGFTSTFYVFVLMCSFSTVAWAGDGLPYDIEERIRMIEDPNYFKYLDRQYEEVQALEKARAEQREDRVADEKVYELRRQKQVEWRRKNYIEVDEEALDRAYEKDYFRRYKEANREDLAYQKEEAEVERQESLALEKRIQTLRQNRLPASATEPPPRVEKKRRKF
ncbi:MAG: hypothetical protein KDD25_08415 [Bdellovibrionales bacterium]|nr:hypothetical protein [Bdellovibrionales bacterium]